MTEIKPQILTAMESKGLLFPNSPIGLRTWYAVEDAGLRYGFNVADDGQLFEAVEYKAGDWKTSVIN